MSDLWSRSVCVQGLAGEVSKDTITAAFGIIGNVEKVLMCHDTEHRFNGVAYVVFESPSLARTASEHLEQQYNVQLAEEEINAHLELAFQQVERPQEQADPFAALFVKSTAGKKPAPVRTPVAPRYPTASLPATPYSPPPTPFSPALPQLAHYQDQPRLSTFSGEAGKDCSFGRWKFEVMCLVKEKYSSQTVNNAIRKSLKAPAAEVLMRLGNVGVEQMLLKFQSLYGTVLSGHTLLQKFYGEKQRDKETCVAWSCRLEDYIYEAMEQGMVTPDAAKKSLPSRFWSGLRDDRVKNALRHRETHMGFMDFVMEARRVEEEYNLPSTGCATAVAKVQQVEKDPMEEILKRLERMETRLSECQGAQQQPPQVSPMNVPPQTPQAFPRDIAMSQPPQARPSVNTCHKCHQLGHMSFSCRQGQDVVCYKCQTKGHIGAGCLNA